jgi:beta-glucosidase
LTKEKLPKQQITEACRRVLKAKFQLGLFDDPYRYCSEERAKSEVFTATNRAEARKAATESFVLLKNDNVLPLKKSGTIAVIGPMANTRENMTGTWSVAARFSESISVMDGLTKAVGTILQSWCMRVVLICTRMQRLKSVLLCLVSH